MRALFTAWTLPRATNIAEFTLLNPDNSYYSPEKLLALKRAFPTESFAALTAYHPARLLLHVCIIQTVIRVQYDTESAFHQYANSLYQCAMLEAQQQIQDFLSERNVLLAAVSIPPAVEKILNEIPDGFKRESPTLAREYAVDRHLQKVITNCLFILVNDIISRYEIEGNLKCVRPCAESEVRKTFLVAGGIASGKGSAAWKIKESAESVGIHYADLIKINGDALKPLLLTPGSVPAVFYSQFCVDEATHIKLKIFAALATLLEENKQYHTFVDETGLKETASDYAMKKKGSLYVNIVSTDAEKAVERSFSRGKKEGENGRYEDTHNILSNHRSIAAALPLALSRLPAEANACIEMWDNNAESPTEMIIIASIDVRGNHIDVFDPELLKRFIRKTSINPDAKSPETLYDDDLTPPNIQQYFGKRFHIHTHQSVKTAIL